MNFTERILKNILQKAGILIRYYSPSSSEEARRLKLIETFDIDTVFDVGANKGQYAISLLDAGFHGQIISFEPQSSAYEKLEKRSEIKENWIVAPRCAIGEQAKEIEMNISGNSVSSTLLTMLDAHTDGEPASKTVSVEKVKVRRLDDIGKEYIKSENVLLKIDVQGYELPVLQGAEGLMNCIRGIELEISAEPLYHGQNWLLPQVLETMNKMGFELHSLTPAFTNKKTGKVLQYNGIFFKKNGERRD